MSVLKLSTDWQFSSVRKSVIEELLPYTHDDPILKRKKLRRRSVSARRTKRLLRPSARLRRLSERARRQRRFSGRLRR
jgi:hypothetical protein